jgi:GABA(A) receptor-associated protein
MIARAERIREKFPDRVPVLLRKSNKSLALDNVDKRKYLVPSDLTMGQFLFVVRRRLKLPAEQAIFIFVQDTIPPSSTLISDIYANYQDPGGFLYMEYSGENTFGQIGLP